jgi:prepilin-type N-terminal cleavage/methylation domain-containing protein
MSRSGDCHGNGGFTLTEVLAALVLTAVGVVPVLHAHIAAQALGTKAQRATSALTLAVKKIEDIRAAARTAFDTDFSTDSSILAAGHLCTVQDGRESSTLKSIKVMVGYDIDGDGALDSEEVDVVLDTQIASMQ